MNVFGCVGKLFGRHMKGGMTNLESERWFMEEEENIIKWSIYEYKVLYKNLRGAFEGRDPPSPRVFRKKCYPHRP